jgi:SpoVK/Ycf46/Vps4 family AAA+-type ATPase
MSKLFVEKVMLNLLTTWRETFYYENLVRRAMHHGAGLFDLGGVSSDWREFLTNKRNAHVAILEARGDSRASSYDYLVPITEYLDKSDMQTVYDMITGSKPELKEDFVLDANIELLGGLLELTPMERLVLQMSAEMQELEYPMSDMFQRLNHDDKMLDPALAYSVLFGKAESEFKNISKSFLLNSGILQTNIDYKYLHQINEELVDSFTDKKLTLDTLDAVLFPSDMSANLDLTCYSHLSKEIERTERVIQVSLDEKKIGTNVMFWGIPGTGKTQLALTLAKTHGWDLKVIGDISKNDATEKSRAQRIASLKIAMKLYAGKPNTVLLFDEMEDLFKHDTNAVFSKAFINRIVESTPVPIIWTTNDLISLGSAVLRRMTYNIAFEIPTLSARRKIWEKHSADYKVDIDADTISSLATNYNIVPALIENAVKISSSAGLAHAELPDIVTSLDRLMNYGEKRKFHITTKKDTPYSPKWANTDLDLDDLTSRLTKAKPNFSLCLYGAPGTGKSEYGRYLTDKIGKPLLYKRASDLISMWVGETEKNIARCFEEAKEEQMVLLIDEGDTFLRSRENAKNSWEVTQVNEMLSQMESHSQPFILTTNLMKELDPAAMRRFTFKMKFNFLRSDQAVELFQAYFGVEAPKAILTNEILAPGDFANIKRKTDILGITDAEEIYKMILEECALKPDSPPRKLGF